MRQFRGHNESGGPRIARVGTVGGGMVKFVIRSRTDRSGRGVTLALPVEPQRVPDVGALVLPTTGNVVLEVGWFDTVRGREIRFWIREPGASAYGWSVVLAPEDARIVLAELGITIGMSPAFVA